MPELPEIESLRRDLSRTLCNRTIVGLELRNPAVFRPAPGFDRDNLQGVKVQDLRRRGKYLVVDLSEGLSLIFHLRLTGQLVHFRDETVVAAGGHPVPAFGTPLPHKSTHAVFALDDASRLYYTDMRRFGFFTLLPTAGVMDYLSHHDLGLEPLEPEFSVEALQNLLTSRGSARLKPLLMDQKAIAGLGNIYSDEVLWLARLHPLRVAGSLDSDEVSRLHSSIQETLGFALREGVASVVRGRASPDRTFPTVHGREGQPCSGCGGSVKRIKVGGRSTYYCPCCQLLDGESGERE